MKLPGDLRSLAGPGAMAFAAPEVEAWVQATLQRGETLYDAACTEADAWLQGRGPVPVLRTPHARWVVRRYRRGGLIAAPLLGQRYLRVGQTRPLREARASHEVRRRGVGTPRVVAGAVYPAGAFYRADLVTELVPDAVDLAQALFGDRTGGAAERTALLHATARLVSRTAAAGIHHTDLNAKNVLIARGPDGAVAPLLLDLDGCRILRPGVAGDPAGMRARLTRSLRKHGERTGRPLAPEEWAAFDGTDGRVRDGAGT